MMSTSSDFTWAANPGEILAFEYPMAGTGTFAKRDRPDARRKSEPQQREAELQEQLRQALEDGKREGELRARQCFDESLLSEREKVAAAISAFAHERSEYFRRVEGEVVQLALAIARKVIHRE